MEEQREFCRKWTRRIGFAGLTFGIGLGLIVLTVSFFCFNQAPVSSAPPGGFLNIVSVETEPKPSWAGQQVTTTVQLRAQWGIPAAETTTLTVTTPTKVIVRVFPPTISETVVVSHVAPLIPGYHQVTAETWRPSDGGGDWVPHWFYVEGPPPPVPFPDLTMSGAIKTLYKKGELLDYALTIGNNGSGAAAGAVLTSTIPLTLTFKSGLVLHQASGDEWGYCQGDGVVVCSIGALWPGQSVSIFLQVTPTVAGPVVILNQVTATPTDPISTNNALTLSTLVVEDTLLPPTMRIFLPLVLKKH